MRKIIWMLFALLLLLTSCSNSKKIYKIGVSQCSAGPWRDKINNEMLAAQHLYDHDVKVSIVCAYDDTKRQIQQIDSMADAGIDLLVVAPNEAEPTGEALARIKARGIPVICFDRTVDENSYTAFIGGSNVEAGRAIGVNVLDVAHGIKDHKPFIMEITALMSSSPAQERHKGFAQAMQGHDEVEYVCREGDWSSDTPYRIALEQIHTGHLPDIVFCHNDGMATGVYRAVAETKTEDRIKIFGIDGMPGEGLEYVQLGHQLASYVYPTGGAEIIKLAINILTGKPYKRQNTLDGILVVKENVWPIATTTKKLLQQNKDLVTRQAGGLFRTLQRAAQDAHRQYHPHRHAHHSHRCPAICLLADPSGHSPTPSPQRGRDTAIHPCGTAPQALAVRDCRAGHAYATLAGRHLR